MPERIGAPLFLLARFAEFFASVVDSKRAIAEGRLGAMLAVGDEPPPVDPGELAARLSARLAAVLRLQEKDIARSGKPTEIDAHRKAMYIMAAVTDEILILEVDWAGRDAWIDVLLEYNLYQSGNAGMRFFEMADELLAVQIPDPLQVDLAAVMLMALQLGFKGRHRGTLSDAELDALRNRLFRLVEREHGALAAGLVFPQTVQALQAGGTPERLASLSTWYTAGAVVLIVHLAVSSALWIWLLEPFRRAVGADG
ncbi:MAG: DotU family type IV/VI secretion system protein [Pseudomonadota bacterium]|nr:DotU family type IV/VI secretion system protein [Pseudomonadota bacterium]